jgi:hypothetical protein
MLRHKGVIIRESWNKVIQVQHINPGITLPVLEALEYQNSKIYKIYKNIYIDNNPIGFLYIVEYKNT